MGVGNKGWFYIEAIRHYLRTSTQTKIVHFISFKFIPSDNVERSRIFEIKADILLVLFPWKTRSAGANRCSHQLVVLTEMGTTPNFLRPFLG
ncbi:hypothetical protein OUZ56_013954 [Daphnia magna]|uniref:Uncharacterized protein n=1 Tax=Daphnia magna TaxID=35525 RepID=A0ABQ9Z7E6_9CRUS|nr:hypothetical protein OUZ56_013954 [Daphnia magna]